MNSGRFRLPEAVRMRVLATGNEAWISGLEQWVAELERRWSIRVGEALDGGSESLVASVVREDGTSAVLKIVLPDTTGVTDEAEALQVVPDLQRALVFAA